MRKVLVCLLTLALVLGCMSVQAEGVLTPGTYTSTMTAMHGPMTVEVTVTDSAITSVEVVDQVETPGVTDPVFEKNSGRDCGQPNNGRGYHHRCNRVQPCADSRCAGLPQAGRRYRRRFQQGA